MNRLSQRISTAWHGVKCPRCGMFVLPTGAPVSDAPPTPIGEDDKRWSFFWRLPRGDFCPECEFPLSKYFGRLKWIRTFMVGVGIAVGALLLQFVGAIGLFGFTYIKVMRIAIMVGAGVTAIGLVGIIVGGRHGRVRIPDKM
jgi:hypothetical protein